VAALGASDLAQLAEKDLYYEVAMLSGAAAEHRQRRSAYPGLMGLDRDNPKRVATMAYFELVLMHARVLHDFLTVKPSGLDDVRVGHYIPNWQPPNPGPLDRVPRVSSRLTLKRSINKQLAHFSDERLKQQKFHVDLVATEVLADMQTFANDTTNQCYTELKGIRTLLSRATVPTEYPPPPSSPYGSAWGPAGGS